MDDSELNTISSEMLQRYLNDPMKAPPFDEAVVDLLWSYQWLEELLKQYILRAECVIRRRVADTFTYTFSADKLFELPLGPLAERFAQRCGDAELVARLRAVVKPRNSLVHRCFIPKLDALGEVADREELRAELVTRKKEVEGVRLAVLSKIAALEEVSK